MFAQQIRLSSVIEAERCIARDTKVTRRSYVGSRSVMRAVSNREFVSRRVSRLLEIELFPRACERVPLLTPIDLVGRVQTQDGAPQCRTASIGNQPRSGAADTGNRRSEQVRKCSSPATPFSTNSGKAQFQGRILRTRGSPPRYCARSFDSIHHQDHRQSERSSQSRPHCLFRLP